MADVNAQWVRQAAALRAWDWAESRRTDTEPPKAELGCDGIAFYCACHAYAPDGSLQNAGVLADSFGSWALVMLHQTQWIVATHDANVRAEGKVLIDCSALGAEYAQQFGGVVCTPIQFQGGQ